jgi:hypothetical protein
MSGIVLAFVGASFGGGGVVIAGDAAYAASTYGEVAFG